MSRIVVFEEDQLMRGLLAEWLSTAGHTVCATTRCADETSERADLVIVDVFMPRYGCASRLRAVKAAYPDTPLIAISGQFRSGLVGSSTTAEMLGVRQVLAKPFTRRDLLAAVHGVIASSC